MPVQHDVEFHNIDLLLVGRFDRKPLLAALRDDVFVLHEDARFDNKKCLILEALAPGLDLTRTLTRLLKWVQGLPLPARRSWTAASRRVFDIGIQSGLKPHDSHWTIRRDQVAALAKVGAEVVLTVYGAEWTRHRAPPRS
jgi:hypothetical protein